MTAPIALFVYNRPSHTRQTVEALQRNKLADQSDLFVYSDAPKSSSANSDVEKVRAYSKQISGFRSVTIIERSVNLGVDASVIDGVTSLCEKFGEVIVLEDDLVTSPVFLTYMNRALDLYRDEESVLQISGFMFPLERQDEQGASFLRYATPWGWATWLRAWKHFDVTAAGYDALNDDPVAQLAFNVNGNYDHFGLLKRFVERTTDAWDIRWYLTIFQREGLTLFPNKTLVDNIGFDGSGVHSSVDDQLTNSLSSAAVTRFPEPRLNTVVWKRMENYLHQRKKLERVSPRRRVLRFVNSKVRGLISRTNSIRFSQIIERAKLMLFKKDIGRDTYIDRTVQILGWKYISIGHSSAISEGTWLNVNHRVSEHKHIVIGNNCYIGKRNFLSSGWQIVLSDYCMTGIDCKFMGSDHIFDDPLKPYIVSGVTNKKVIRLGANVWLGAGVSIIGNIQIGHGSVVGAGSLVNRDIPPFSIVVGNPCRVYKRYDFALGTWVEAAGYQSEHDAAMPDEADYLDLLRKSFPKVPIPLQAAGRSFGDML